MAFHKIGGSDPNLLIGAMASSYAATQHGESFFLDSKAHMLPRLCQHDELYRCPRIYPTRIWIFFGMATYMGFKGAVYCDRSVEAKEVK